MAYQGRPWEVTLSLTSSGSPALGVLYSDVTIKTRKYGETVLSTRVLDSEDWIELESGFYVLKFPEADMDVVGPYFFDVFGTGFDPQAHDFNIEPAPLALLAAPEKCIISGNIVDLGGQVGQPLNVNFRVAKVPMLVGGTSFVNSDLIRTSPDTFGNFSVSLLRGAEVLVDIERSGLRHKITVPDQETALLVDLLPPIP